MAFSYREQGSIPERDDVRLYAQDTDRNEFLFHDEEIDRFLVAKGGNVLRASALALDTAASNQTLVLKVTRSLDFNADGAAVARSLRESAKALRLEADQQEQEDGAGFDIAEQPYYPWQYREVLRTEVGYG